MEDYYLWGKHIPSDIEPSNYKDSYTFFNLLKYEDDQWSWLSDDYYETSDMLDGITTTAGLEFFLRYKAKDDIYNVVGIVEYVLPESPAQIAGIKRGNVFSSINNTSLNIDNYYELLTSYKSYIIIGFDSIEKGN